MRQQHYAMPTPDALAMLAEAPYVHLASSLEDGTPVLRALNGVVFDGAIAFHGSPAGEKAGLVGRPAVVAVEETLADIPSYWVDPRRACPASVYYRSVQAHGTIELVTEPAARARVLAELMARRQPEGGYTPIEVDHPLYKGAIAGIMVLRVKLDRVDGKVKLGQNRKPEELVRILEGMWERGATGDPRAIELVRRANPEVPVPGFLRGPAGTTFAAWLDTEDARTAGEMLAEAYWNPGIGAERLAIAHRSSTAWVGARDPEGRLVATARAMSDDVKNAWIYDVMVDPAWRGRGVGSGLVRFLLDHPRLRGVRRVFLTTRDAQPVYTRLGFDEYRIEAPRSHMVFARA